MDRRIYKYPLVFEDQQFVELPVGSDILSVAEQRGQIVLYAIVDTEEEDKAEVLVYIYGTGNPMGKANPRAKHFLGTVNTHNGALMWHVFVPRREV
jgi:hypothetical protein